MKAEGSRSGSNDENPRQYYPVIFKPLNRNSIVWSLIGEHVWATGELKTQLHFT